MSGVSDTPSRAGLSLVLAENAFLNRAPPDDKHIWEDYLIATNITIIVNSENKTILLNRERGNAATGGNVIGHRGYREGRD